MDLLVVGHMYRDMRVARDGVQELLGGAPAYAMIAPNLGISAGIISSVGPDFTEGNRKRLVKSGLDTSGLHQSGRQTTQIITRMDEQGEHKLLSVIMAPPITDHDLQKHHLQSTVIFFAPILREVDRSCILPAARNEAIIAVDIEGYLRKAESGHIVLSSYDYLSFLLGYTMILKVDEVTLSIITEEATEEKSIEYLLRHGPPIVVLMRGELGSSIFTRHGREDIPYIVPKDIIDTAGFDNVYMIGFLTEFIKTGGDIERSGYFAATCASLSAESAGPFQKITRRQIEKRMKTIY